MKSKFLHKAEKLPQQHTSQFRGLDIIIEWPKGSIRVGENPDGTKWKREMHADYGYVRDANTVNDHEELDVYVGPDKEAENVYIVEQLKDDGELDEYKVMLGFDSLEDAKEMYLKHYPKDWEETHLGGISEVPFEYVFDTIEEFKEKHAEPVIDSGQHISLEELEEAGRKTAKIVDGKRVDGWTGAETGLRCQPDYMESGSYCREMNEANEKSASVADIYQEGLRLAAAQALQAPDITQTPAFKAWFAGSKVVDKQGQPLVMYHATQSDIGEFHAYTHFGTQGAANDRHNNLWEFYNDTLHNPERAKGSNIMPVYLSVKNPLRMPDLASIDDHTGQPLPDEPWDEESGEEEPYVRGWEGEEAIPMTLYEMGIMDIDDFEEHRRNEDALKFLEQKGYDGIVYKNVVEDPGNDSWIVFRPNQIKSAVGNSGNFDPASSQITASLSNAIEFAERRISAEESSFAGTTSPGLRIEAHQDNQTVGAIEIYFEGGNAYVRGITVAPEYQGRGIGQQLYDKAISSAKQEGCGSFYSDKANCMSHDADKAWDRLRKRYKVEFESGEGGYDSTGRKKIRLASAEPKCPHCGSDDYGLMPSDFETAKCNSCGKNWEHGIVDGVNNPKTAAPVHDEMRSKKFYHGTNFENAAQAILQNGIQPRNIIMPDKAKSRAQLAPVPDRVYLTTDIKYAAIYALGGSMFGTGESASHRITDVNPYGYIFEIDGADLSGDVVPDEDSIGEAVCALSQYRHYQDLLKQIDKTGERYKGQTESVRHWIDFYAKKPVCQPDTPYDVQAEIMWFFNNWVTEREKGRIDEVAYQAQIGKKFQKRMTRDTAKWLIDHGAHVAHRGPVFPARCWRFSKKDALHTSKDNLASILQEVPLPDKTASVTAKSEKQASSTAKTVATKIPTSNPWSVFAKVQRGFSMGKIIQPNKKA